MSSPRSDKKPAIKLSAADVSAEATSSVVGHLQAAQQVPLVRNVGEAKQSRGGLLTLLFVSLAGIGGGLLTWVLWLPIPAGDSADPTMTNLMTSIALALAMVIVIVAVESGLTRSWVKVGKSFLIALPAGLVLSVLLGLLANGLFQNMVTDIYRRAYDMAANGEFSTNAEATNYLLSQMHLPRGLAWALMGLAAGIAIGLTSLSVKRILVTAAGGLVGGFIGGFVFDFFTGDIEAIPQIVGLVVTGLAIGLSIGLIEQATKTSWIEIIQGGMAGKQFILYKADVTLGSSPSADITLIKDPSIPGLAARLTRRGSSIMLTSLDAKHPVSVNGLAVSTAPISEGAQIALGTTIVRFRQRNKKEVSASIVRN